MSQEKIGLMVLRYALVIVYVYFGVSQLVDVDRWVAIVPEWATTLSTLSAGTVVMLNAVFELIFAALLALGFWLRSVSFILAAHLAVITLTMGFTPTGMRDLGLTLATLAHGLLEGNKKSEA